MRVNEILIVRRPRPNISREPLIVHGGFFMYELFLAGAGIQQEYPYPFVAHLAKSDLPAGAV